MSTLIIGHRGASGHLPENTLPAFEKAIEMKADGVELDIWPNKSGEPIVIHDESLSRTTKHKGKVTQMVMEDLSPLGIPTYRDVLAVAEGKLMVFTELKGPREERVAEAIAEAVASGKWTYSQLPVIGFDHEQLARVKKADSDIRIGLSFSKKMLEPIPADKRVAYMVAKASGMHASGINPQYTEVTPELVEAAHKAGLSVNVWTVNSDAGYDKMLALDVDSIMTDYPDRLYKKLHAAAE